MDKRASPDELLSYVTQTEAKAQRGKLKIFFGASPGVGKTYAMLQDALLKQGEGLDVLVGLVESHGRTDTQNLLEQLPQLPRKKIEYKGKVLEEFDLDAAIARRPALLLVDEMAHTNAPTSRHEKRWQDIKELIERGIDVYTALNVQHIESLNDVVAQITGVRVRETVPDSMLDMIDSIELIDLAPEDLLQRLHEGKVYVPTQAKLAMDKFFRKQNLVALRELALRVTAEKVNTELLTERRGQAENVWPTTERLLVCVGPGARAAKLIRSACRLANKLQAEWIAVYIKSPERKESEKIEKSALDNLRLAEQLGAETTILADNDFVQAIITYARRHNVSKIVLSKQIRPRWKALFGPNLVDELLRYSDELDIYIIQNEEPEMRLKSSWFEFNVHSSFGAYCLATLYVLLATLLNFGLNKFLDLDNSNLIMIYLLTVIAVALRGQRGPSFVASLMSVLLYDFCFVPPRFSFAVSDSQYIITLVVMLIVTQVISHLTLLTKWQITAARQREQRTERLLGLSRQLAEHRGMTNLLNKSAQYLGETFHANVIALLPDETTHLQYAASFGPQIELDHKEQSIAKWSFDLKQMAGLGTETLADSRALYVPLLVGETVFGVLYIKPNEPEQFLTPENRHALASCIRQISLTLAVESYSEV